VEAPEAEPVEAPEAEPVEAPEAEPVEAPAAAAAAEARAPGTSWPGPVRPQ